MIFVAYVVHEDCRRDVTRCDLLLLQSQASLTMQGNMNGPDLVQASHPVSVELFYAWGGPGCPRLETPLAALAIQHYSA